MHVETFLVGECGGQGPQLSVMPALPLCDAAIQPFLVCAGLPSSFWHLPPLRGFLTLSASATYRHPLVEGPHFGHIWVCGTPHRHSITFPEFGPWLWNHLPAPRCRRAHPPIASATYEGDVMPLTPPSHLHVCLGPWPLAGSWGGSDAESSREDSASQATDEGGPDSCSIFSWLDREAAPSGYGGPVGPWCPR